MRSRASAGITAAIKEFALNARVVTAGAKGCVVFADDAPRDYRGFLAVDDASSHAHWLFQLNGGVFLPPWGKIEQWLISVQHNEFGHRSADRQFHDVSMFIAFTTLFTAVHLGTVAQVLGLVTWNVSWPAIVVQARLVTIGRQYEEAAADLGANQFQVARRVLLPLLAPAIFASAVLGTAATAAPPSTASAPSCSRCP